MAWNTSATPFKSTLLAGIDCGTGGNYVKGPAIAQQSTRLWADFTYTSAVSAGQCIAMLRVPAGTRIVGGRLTAQAPVPANTLLAVGDPYACGRFLGPVNATTMNIQTIGGAGAGNNCGFDCGVFTRSGKAGLFSNGDGCGLGYVYTCETDIFVTVLYTEVNASMGGWAGSSSAAGTIAGAALAANAYLTLTLEVLPV